MNERNFYLTGTRIATVLVVLLSLGVTWFIAITYLSTYSSILTVVAGYAPILFLTCIMVYACYVWLQVHPFQNELEADNLSVNDLLCLLDSEMYDGEANLLGRCKGIYMTEQDIRVMINGRLYDVTDVYLYDGEEEDDDDEQ